MKNSDLHKLPMLCLLGILLLMSQNVAAQSSADYKKLLDKKAPEWIVNGWVNSPQLQIDQLKGKVVLIRWWLETCPYCKASAPTLNEFYDAYKDEGLEIIGMYHPKPFGRKVTAEEVKMFADAKEFEFPIAIDQEWKSLRTYWPDEVKMNYTSVSFLLDRKGIIRYIHPGGSYSKLAEPFRMEQWREDYYEIKKILEGLLRQK